MNTIIDPIQTPDGLQKAERMATDGSSPPATASTRSGSDESPAHVGESQKGPPFLNRTRGQPAPRTGAHDPDIGRNAEANPGHFQIGNRFGLRHGASWIKARDPEAVLPPELPLHVHQQVETARAGLKAIWAVSEHVNIPSGSLGMSHLMTLISMKVCLEEHVRVHGYIPEGADDLSGAAKRLLAVLRQLGIQMTKWGLDPSTWYKLRTAFYMDGDRDWEGRLDDKAAAAPPEQTGGFPAEAALCEGPSVSSPSSTASTSSTPSIPSMAGTQESEARSQNEAMKATSKTPEDRSHGREETEYSPPPIPSGSCLPAPGPSDADLYHQLGIAPGDDEALLEWLTTSPEGTEMSDAIGDALREQFKDPKLMEAFAARLGQISMPGGSPPRQGSEKPWH